MYWEGQLTCGLHLLGRGQKVQNRFALRDGECQTHSRSSKPLRGSLRCPGWVRLPPTPANKHDELRPDAIHLPR